MNVVSYNIQEMEPKWTKDLKGPSIITNTRFLNNPKKTKMISKLSAQYNSFKKTYNFPTKYKSKLLNKPIRLIVAIKHYCLSLSSKFYS